MSQLEVLCKQLYETGDASVRAEAEKALVQFSSTPDCLNKCQLLLERGHVSGNICSFVEVMYFATYFFSERTDVFFTLCTYDIVFTSGVPFDKNIGYINHFRATNSIIDSCHFISEILLRTSDKLLLLFNINLQ